MQYLTLRTIPLLLLLVLPAAVAAEVVSASGSLGALRSLYGDDSRVSRAFSEGLELNLAIAGRGNLAVRFDSYHSNTWQAYLDNGSNAEPDSSPVLLLQGRAIKGDKELPAAGAIYEGTSGPELHINLVDEKPMEASIPLGLSSQAAVGTAAYADESMLAGKRCGSELMPKHSPSFSSAKATRAAANIRVIDISTDADYQFYQLFGSQANARIASIINAAQVIYQSDLGLRFNIVRQRVRTSSSQPFTSSDSEVLLDQYTDFIGGDHAGADVSHLFSGKDINDGVIGIAWLGVVCNQPTIATGVTQHVSSTIDPLVFAHEIGHNLNAEHDRSTAPRSLMYPSVSSDQGFVSEKSRNEVNNHIAQHGSCLTETDEPAPDPRVGDSESVSVAPTFSRSRGRLKLSVKRSGFSDNDLCSLRVSFSSSSNMANSRTKTFLSSADRILLSARTSRRIASGRIYVRARVFNCDSSPADVTSSIRSFSPLGQRGITARTWIRQVLPTLSGG
jgi:hypothetical protein